MEIIPSTIFLGMAFIATLLTLGGSMMPSITLRVGSSFMWLSCAIFVLFSTGLSGPVYTALVTVFLGLFILCMINFATGITREKKMTKYINEQKKQNKNQHYEYNKDRK
jgi:uncharacterized membrane protein